MYVQIGTALAVVTRKGKCRLRGRGRFFDIRIVSAACGLVVVPGEGRETSR